MRIQWYGQSAFALTGDEHTVFIDPFGDMTPLAGRGVQWDYPAIEGVSADLLLVTHEHLDHNAIEALERWRFRPGTRAGAPADFESVIYVPFSYENPRD